MTTEEGNKLIAIFMGWTSSKSSDAGILGGSIEYWRNPNDGHVGYSHPNRYNSDWNELMSVLGKIEKLACNVNIINNYCQIIKFSEGHSSEPEYQRTQTMASTKIENVWNAVIQFIQWYNEQKTKHETI